MKPRERERERERERTRAKVVFESKKPDRLCFPA